ncbi:MAG TPA: MFS transporter, partial [Firmicutes bacterium]|nr:MFS transporter [Bacillota bacterium]
VVQPIFGLYSDRSSLPWLMPLGIGLATVGVSLAGVMPHYYLVIAAVFISGLGVAAYHPEGTKTAHFAAGDRRSSAMSVYSVGGNLGFGLGPILGALFLGTWGLTGSLAFLAPGLATTVAFYFLLPKISAATGRAREDWYSSKELARENGAEKPAWSWGLAVLIVMVIFRSWIQYGLVSYLPFYYTDYLGGEKHIAVALVSVFLISGAVGTLIGGPLADRFGTKKHICISMALMFPLLCLLLKTSGSAAALVVTSLAGMVLISTFSPTVVMGQQYLPHHIGLASGLLIGFAVGMGGLGVPVLGVFADKFGVDLVLKILAALPLAGLLMALFLPRPPEEKMKTCLSEEQLKEPTRV